METESPRRRRFRSIAMRQRQECLEEGIQYFKNCGVRMEDVRRAVNREIRLAKAQAQQQGARA